MATSLMVAGGNAGVKHGNCKDAARAFLAKYRSSIQMFARMPVLEVARYQVHRLQHVASMEEIFRLAERATPMHALVTLTEVQGGAATTKSVEGKSVKSPVAKKPRRRGAVLS